MLNGGDDALEGMVTCKRAQDSREKNVSRDTSRIHANSLRPGTTCFVSLGYLLLFTNFVIVVLT